MPACKYEVPMEDILFSLPVNVQYIRKSNFSRQSSRFDVQISDVNNPSKKQTHGLPFFFLLLAGRPRVGDAY